MNGIAPPRGAARDDSLHPSPSGLVPRGEIKPDPGEPEGTDPPEACRTQRRDQDVRSPVKCLMD